MLDADLVMPLTIRPVRVQTRWHGTFAQPVFGVFANPSSVYARLYEALAPYGADLDSIGIEAANLSQAQITCHLLELGIVVRLKMDRLEISRHGIEPEGRMRLARIIDLVVLALRDLDANLAPHRVDVSIDGWASIIEGTYPEWASKYVSLPAPIGDVAEPEFAAEAPTWSIRFERAARFVNPGLYYRFNGIYEPSSVSSNDLDRADSEVTSLLSAFGVRVGA